MATSDSKLFGSCHGWWRYNFWIHHSHFQDGDGDPQTSSVSIENFHSGREHQRDLNFDILFRQPDCRPVETWKEKQQEEPQNPHHRHGMGVKSCYWSDSNALNLDSFGMGLARGPSSQSNRRTYVSLRIGILYVYLYVYVHVYVYTRHEYSMCTN